MFYSILLWIARTAGRVQFYGSERISECPENKGLILISNHPSLWEPALYPSLFFPRCLFSSRRVPHSVVDKANYYDKCWFAPIRPFLIPIERGNARRELQTIQEEIRPFLEQGGVLILFPEGSRTFKAKKIRGGKRSPSGGREIGEFPRGIRKLFADSDFLILPCWAEGGDKVVPNKESFSKTIFQFPNFLKKTTIIIGEPFSVRDISKDRIVEYLEDKLLQVKEG